jgi:hypothetical protein
MELADCGVQVAAMNAGRALLELKAELPFADQNHRKKLATMMFKRSLALEDRNAPEYLFKAYLARGQSDKAFHAISNVSTSPAFYYFAEAHVMGYLPLRILPLFGNLSHAMSTDPSFLLPVLTLIPQVLSVFTSQVVKCVKSQCSPEEIDDLGQFAVWFFKQYFSDLAAILGIVCLIVLVRRRVAHCFLSREPLESDGHI